MTRDRILGFTLIEVLVALAIVAISLVAGLQATMSLSNNAQRLSDVLLAQVCAENALVGLRLQRREPPIGEANFPCEQAGQSFSGVLMITTTPNPNFRRVEAQVRDGDFVVLRLATVIGSLR